MGDLNPAFRHLRYLFVLLLPACRPPAVDPAATTAVIHTVLDDQVAAWNRGDLAGFMAGYAHTDSLQFVSGGTVRRGWQATLDRYLNTYPDRAAMGALAFEDLEVRVLSPRWATVFGSYRLRREGAYEDLRGRFTLLFEKRPEGWRIRYDHTSAGA